MFDCHGAQEPVEWKMLIGITNYVSTLCVGCWLSQTGTFLMMISSSSASTVWSSQSCCHTVFESTSNSSSWRRLGIVKDSRQKKQWLLMGNLDKAIFTSPVSTTTHLQPIHVGSPFSLLSTVPWIQERPECSTSTRNDLANQKLPCESTTCEFRGRH